MIFYALLGFIILVFFHEFGHFIMAKIVGIRVEEFAIGMGKSIVSKNYKGTLYKINIFPIGGYCKLKGQDDFSAKIENFDEDSFYGRPATSRILVAFGGPLFSYLLGFFLLFTVLYFTGETKLNYTKIAVSSDSLLKDGDEIVEINNKKIDNWQDLQIELLSKARENTSIKVKRDGNLINIENFFYDPSREIIARYKKSIPIIINVLKDSPADKVKIRPYTRIVSINNIIPSDEAKLFYAINYSNLPLSIKLEAPKNIFGVIVLDIIDYLDYYFDFKRDNIYSFIQNFIDFNTVSIMPQLSNERKIIGIQYYFREYEIDKYVKKINYTIFESFDRAFSQSFNVIMLSVKGISKIFKGEIDVKSNVAGPLKIFKQLGEAGSYGGIFAFMNFTAIISLALAFFNLIPFPALDGGHIVVNFFEVVARRRPSPKIIGAIQVVGIVILLSLLFIVSINDIFGL
ncbi:MAG TPA: RIP metalloprotease RseP [Spirochaetota bacterium]|nr:RIP metalloprotease RseP [Spirochaetota bacterium]HOM38019.1 RIP metalloprotease RseP [Spirochaetota bacterium]HPQ48823.1 RIP metalloprotease RseP [Spirochaetota bacterium]